MDAAQHLYIHWPFCKNKCYYCDFVALERHEQFVQSYHMALCNEIRTYSKNLSVLNQKPIKTVFFGGGTPSLYPLDLMEELFGLLYKTFTFEKNCEVSFEVNPGGITKQHCQTWKRLGINRLSVGVQVLNDSVLARLNRMQKNEDVYELMGIASQYFNNMSADLIVGLPGVTEKIWQDTLRQVVSFPITHASMYLLMVHEKTPLYFKVKKGEVALPSDDAMAAIYESSVAFFEQHGFEQYEISNFARAGFQSVHNKAYWDRKAYKGFGIGAASYDGHVRRANIKNLSLYIDTYKNGPLKRYDQALEIDEIGERQAIIEEFMLSLRQRCGMDLHRMIYLLGPGKKVELLGQIELLEKHGLVRLEGGSVVLTLRGMLLENEIVLSLV